VTSSGVRRNLVWGGDIINMYYFQSLFFIIIQKKKKKMQSGRKFILRVFTLNSSIICSIDNGMSRCMFINANPFNHDCPVIFLIYVFKRLGLKKSPWGIYPPSPPPHTHVAGGKGNEKEKIENARYLSKNIKRTCVMLDSCC
jgi:hypothetical protein